MSQQACGLLGELASSGADSSCLTFSTGHGGALGRQQGPPACIDLKNSVSDYRPILKYLVLITATTFTLAGYCWNIIPSGLCSKGTSPLFNHGADGSRCRTQALFFFFLFFYLRNGTTEAGCLRQRPLENKETRHFTALNYTAAPSDWGVRLISLVGLVDFWTSYLISRPVHLPASPAHSCTNECAQCCSLRYGDEWVISPPIVHAKMEKPVKFSRRPVAPG